MDLPLERYEQRATTGSRNGRAGVVVLLFHGKYHGFGTGGPGRAGAARAGRDRARRDGQNRQNGRRAGRCGARRARAVQLDGVEAGSGEDSADRAEARMDSRDVRGARPVAVSRTGRQPDSADERLGRLQPVAGRVRDAGDSLLRERRAAPHDKAKAEHRWDVFDNVEISRQTVGIVAHGDIGRAVAWRAKAMGMRVLAQRRNTAPRAGDEDVDRVYGSRRAARDAARMRLRCGDGAAHARDDGA